MAIEKIHFTSESAKDTQDKLNANFSEIDTAISGIPTKTSDLTNDGDGASNFATENYVDTYGGKIDSISVNSVAQTIDEDKNVDITVPTQASDVNALPDSTKYGASLSVSGTSVSLKDQDGTVLSTITTQDNNDNQKVKTSSVTFGSNDEVEIVGGTNVTVTGNASAKTITIASSYTDTNTWRPVKVNGTEKLTNSTSGNSLDLVAGTNITLSESSGAVTITATDTDTGATSVAETGSGNAYTASSYDSGTRKITFTKGKTFVETKPDGTNDLISNNKITATYLPDYLLGQLLYGGTVTGAGVATLSTNAKSKLGTTSNSITLTNDTTAITGYSANEGLYYIASSDGSFASLGLLTGDWLISTGSAWKKIDNTDALTGVKGNAENSYRTGNVNITPANIGVSLTTTTGSEATTVGSNSLNVVTRDTEQTITAKKTFNNNIVLARGTYLYGRDTLDNNSTGLIGLTSADQVLIGSATAPAVRVGTSTALLPYTTENRDLGSSSYKWKDAYLSGSLKDGTNSITIAKIQSTDNLKTSISSSSTNSEYPSAKLLYDQLALKQNVIDSSHKLSADYVDDTSTTNKFVTASDKTTWNGKQNAITEYSFTSSDAGWSALTNGYYTLTITSAKKPFVCYNSSKEQVMAGLKYDGTNIYVITDTKFAGSVWAF